jgi:hypothetical protein
MIEYKNREGIERNINYEKRVVISENKIKKDNEYTNNISRLIDHINQRPPAALPTYNKEMD